MKLMDICFTLYHLIDFQDLYTTSHIYPISCKTVVTIKSDTQQWSKMQHV